MPPILQQKSSLISLVLYIVGIALHIKGRNLSTDQTAALTQGLGCLFDIAATNILYFVALHNKNKEALASHTEALVASGTATPNPSSTNANVVQIARIFLLGLVLYGVTGCAALQQAFGPKADDRTKVYQLEQTFDLALEGLTTAYQNHLITDKQWEAINPAVLAANAALSQLHQDVDAKKPIDGSEEWTAINAALNQLAVYKWSTTQPSH